MNSSSDTQMRASPSFEGIPIRLKIRGLDHVPSFKNQKAIFKRRNGQRFIATKPDRKKWMEQATRLIESQLRSEYQMRGIGISTAPRAQFLTQCAMPLDDSRQWISELRVNYVKVEKCEEGADITIDRI
jgi:hypothetical protein